MSCAYASERTGIVIGYSAAITRAAQYACPDDVINRGASEELYHFETIEAVVDAVHDGKYPKPVMRELVRHLVRNAKDDSWKKGMPAEFGNMVKAIEQDQAIYNALGEFWAKKTKEENQVERGFAVEGEKQSARLFARIRENEAEFHADLGSGAAALYSVANLYLSEINEILSDKATPDGRIDAEAVADWIGEYGLSSRLGDKFDGFPELDEASAKALRERNTVVGR
jgi:hypothetical protein